MNKLCVCCLTLIVLLFANTPKQGLAFDGKQGRYTFYTESKSSCAVITETDSIDALRIKEKLKNVTGESLKFTNDFKYLDDILKRYQAVNLFEERLQNKTCLYFYSPKINSCVIINGKKVNLHVVYDDEHTVVGTPLIFGSF